MSNKPGLTYDPQRTPRTPDLESRSSAGKKAAVFGIGFGAAALAIGGVYVYDRMHQAPSADVASAPAAAAFALAADQAQVWNCVDGDACWSMETLKGRTRVKVVGPVTGKPGWKAVIAPASGGPLSGYMKTTDLRPLGSEILVQSYQYARANVTGSLNGRVCPSTDCSIMTTVPDGTPMRILNTPDAAPGWREADIPTGNGGYDRVYVQAKFLQILQP